MNRRRSLQWLATLGVPWPAWAQSPPAPTHPATAGAPTAEGDAAFWNLAREGGCVLLMRHAATEPGIGDPPNFRLGDCRTQRNLSDAGRADATRVGLRFRAEGVGLSAVYSSAWCRCTDTARLAFDPHYPAHRVWPALNSFFQGQGNASGQTREVVQRVRGLKAPDNWMLVTHQVNISALTGSFLSMGEVLLTRFDPDRPERLQLLARWQAGGSA
jgi:broad specificity phosphatase PhoE